MINLIWAMTNEQIIANNATLPWNIKEEMQYFKNLTRNKTVLMGSKTFLSIGKPLPERKNIIITNNPKKFANDYCIISNDLSHVLQEYSDNKDNELWVIGGAQIYQQSFACADYLYVSIIKENYPGNLKFPISDFSAFKLIKKTNYEKFTAYIYQRKDK